MYKEINGNKYLLVRKRNKGIIKNGQFVSMDEIKIVKGFGVVRYYATIILNAIKDEIIDAFRRLERRYFDG